MRSSWPTFLLALAALLMVACSGSEEQLSTPTLSPAAAESNTAVSSTTASVSVPAAESSQVVGATEEPGIPLVEVWRPALRTSWQWQLNVLPIDQSFDVEMYDIDLFDNNASIVAELQAQGRKVVCYVNAGGWENYRPDAAQFPEEVIGSNLDDWAGERWLDIRRLDVLAPIMEARMDSCKAKGFDGVEPDNVDGFLNDTGFPLTYDDQLRYNIMLADAAHARGLSIGLKNDMDQIADLLPFFDWALNEQCFEHDECETLSPFIDAGKAVFHVEYELETSEFCVKAKRLGFNSMRKNMNLDASRQYCD